MQILFFLYFLYLFFGVFGHFSDTGRLLDLLPAHRTGFGTGEMAFRAALTEEMATGSAVKEPDFISQTDRAAIVHRNGLDDCGNQVLKRGQRGLRPCMPCRRWNNTVRENTVDTHHPQVYDVAGIHEQSHLLRIPVDAQVVRHVVDQHVDVVVGRPEALLPD